MNLTGLTPGTAYIAQITAKYESGKLSLPSAVHFTTGMYISSYTRDQWR